MKTKILLLTGAILLLSASCNSASPLPIGMAKTVNGGADWQFANTYASSTKISLAALGISTIALDPSNHETVYGSTYEDGLFKSTDSAATWTQILSKILVYDFAINPINNKEIYAVGIYNNHGNVLKTTDGGASWQQVYNEASENNPVRAIALNPTNPSQIVIGLESGNVVRSYDGVLTWKLSNNFDARVNRISWQAGSIYILLREKGLYKTDSSADNYMELTGPVTSNTAFNGSNVNSESSYNEFYVDPVSMSLMYVTTSRGLFKSVDAGKTWNFVAIPVKADADDTRAIAVSRASSNIVYTSIDNIIYKSSDAGSTWQTQSLATAGFVNYILIDQSLPQIVYAGVYPSQ